MTYILNRLREPSTYAALAAIMAMFGINLDPGIMQYIATIGAAGSGLAGIFMRG